MGKRSGLSTAVKVLIGVGVILVLGFLSAIASDNLNTRSSADVSPGPTFEGGEPMNDDIVRRGEVCNDRHPFDEDAFLRCMMTSS